MAGTTGAYVPGQGSTEESFISAGGQPTPIETPTPTPIETPIETPQIMSSTDLADLRASQQEIENKQAAAAAARRAQADSIFNPLIASAQATGEKREGSIESQLGVSRGLGLSTAGASFILEMQKETAASVADVTAKKAEFIASGDLAAADRAQAQINRLEDQAFQISQAKANMAIEMMNQTRADKQLSLQEDAQAFNMEAMLANLTGSFRGSPTFAAEQAAINNALSIAGLTGEFNGAPTFQAKQAVIQNAFTQAGIDLQEMSLAESIRSNRVQEGLAAARLAADEASTENFLTRSVLNKLNVVGVPDGSAVFIANAFSTKSEAEVKQDLAIAIVQGQGNELGVSSKAVFEDAMVEAEKLVNNYISIINKKAEVDLSQAALDAIAAQQEGFDDGLEE